MKTIKGLGLFAGLVVLVSACFNPPEFSVEPTIEFESFYFGRTTSTEAGAKDSLVVALNFKDGDGDLGLDASGAEGSNADHSVTPFNPFNFFLAKDGELNPVGLSYHWSNIAYYFIDTEDHEGNVAEGKLVTLKTRKQAAYSTLPPFSLNSCYWAADTIIMVDGPDAAILDATTQNIIDTLTSAVDPPIYVLQDTFYIEVNPNHYNIKATLLVKNNTTKEFNPYDWGECNPGFDARFPVLSDKEGPLEGVLRYSLKASPGLFDALLVQTLMLEITIKDRKLHSSNTIRTPEFTLDRIRR